MPGFFSFTLTKQADWYAILKHFKWNFVIILSLVLSSCGRVYFPIELQTISRSDRLEQQENSDVKIVPMTTASIKNANLFPYKRRVIEAGDLKRPARLVDVEKALVENYPTNNNPGPYIIGVGDVITLNEINTNSQGTRSFNTLDLVVDEKGFIHVFGLGQLKASGLTLSDLEDYIEEGYRDNDLTLLHNIFFKNFNSKKIFIAVENEQIRSIPYVSIPMYLEVILTGIGIKAVPGSDAKVTLLRNGKEFIFSATKLLRAPQSKFRLFPNDKIFITPLNYRNEAVLVVGETGAQRTMPINSFLRPTLSDTLFSGAVLSNNTSDFSQIYVLRKSNKSFLAYHLDITNPTRVSLASKFEMRPDDIIFVATQPLSLYSRTLSQILGSTGLTLEARDTLRSEIGN